MTGCNRDHTAQSWIASHWFGLSVSSLVLVGLTIGPRAQAQSIQAAPDTIVNHSNDQFEITGGQTSQDGANLFHSFERFNLNAGEAANFVVDEQNRNVLGRVIGGDPSIINGLLQVTGGTSNLYLINPSGILFGPDVQLNLPGSFFATTADRLRFADGWLDIYEGDSFADLVGDPTGFVFTPEEAGAIVNLGELRVTEGDLGLLGGTVVSTGTLAAPTGNIVVTAVAGGQEIEIRQRDGGILSLSIYRHTSPDPATDDTSIPVTALPELLTGSGFDLEASNLTVEEDGRVWLRRGGSEPTQMNDPESPLQTQSISFYSGISLGIPITANVAAIEDIESQSFVILANSIILANPNILLGNYNFFVIDSLRDTVFTSNEGNIDLGLPANIPFLDYHRTVDRENNHEAKYPYPIRLIVASTDPGTMPPTMPPPESNSVALPDPSLPVDNPGTPSPHTTLVNPQVTNLQDPSSDTLPKIPEITVVDNQEEIPPISTDPENITSNILVLETIPSIPISSGLFVSDGNNYAGDSVGLMGDRTNAESRDPVTIASAISPNSIDSANIPSTMLETTDSFSWLELQHDGFYDSHYREFFDNLRLEVMTLEHISDQDELTLEFSQNGINSNLLN